MVERKPSKLHTRVRFPSPAPLIINDLRRCASKTRHPKINWPPEFGADDVRMNTEHVKNAEKHRCRRDGVFAFGRRGVLVVQNGARRALEQEKQSMKTEKR